MFSYNQAIDGLVSKAGVQKKIYVFPVTRPSLIFCPDP